MNVRVVASLGVALFAGVAAYFIATSMSGNDDPVQIVEPIKEETVRVLIATRDIQRGERLQIEDGNWVAWPKKALQPSFITDELPESRDAVVGGVARAMIIAGEPIVAAKVVQAGDSGLMAAILSPGMRAVTMRVSPETSSGGFILPGDRVDVLHTSGRDNSAKTKLMFEDVRVLAVNTLYSENTETPHIDGVNVTLEMAPRDAEGFTSARTGGSLSLVLRSIFKPEGDVVAQERRSTDVNVIRYGRS
ncbi:MAG: Flp pilus assembly protein CpaB [Marinicaulis sp.]|nr:Flp pilus assembly protein CpaB [Marinicaulis sp.]NNE39751.1 Flp pilus assembly protein CpaB [Marinicaulis sp.]NNL89940.1 Flp pilus assembly protein CpaB [Marinicaulis sp.]